jgi:hypothetical protein
VVMSGKCCLLLSANGSITATELNPTNPRVRQRPCQQDLLSWATLLLRTINGNLHPRLQIHLDFLAHIRLRHSPHGPTLKPPRFGQINHTHLRMGRMVTDKCSIPVYISANFLATFLLDLQRRRRISLRCGYKSLSCQHHR